MASWVDQKGKPWGISAFTKDGTFLRVGKNTSRGGCMSSHLLLCGPNNSSSLRSIALFKLGIPFFWQDCQPDMSLNLKLCYCERAPRAEFAFVVWKSFRCGWVSATEEKWPHAQGKGVKETASEWRALNIKHKMLEGFVGIYLNSIGKKQDHLKNISYFSHIMEFLINRN